MTLKTDNRLIGFEAEVNLRDSDCTSLEQVAQSYRNSGLTGATFVYDGSNGVDVEMVMAPMLLNQQGKETLKRHLQFLSGLGICDNNPNSIHIGCGLHIHVSNAFLKDGINETHLVADFAQAQRTGASYDPIKERSLKEPMTTVAVIDILNRYRDNQAKFNSMFPRSRTNYTYARPILEGTIAGDTVQELANRFTVGKYSVVNLETWRRKGTIEFRQAAGTLNFDKIWNWAQHVVTLVNHSCVNRIGFIQEQTETPVEAPFRSQHERNAMCYLMARRDGGVSTVELMDATGCNDRNIRQAFSAIRDRMAQRGYDRNGAVIQHDQMSNGHQYGSGTHLNGYEIPMTISIDEMSTELMAENVIGNPSIWAEISDELFTWWQSRIAQLR
jgi:hypothetical protein